MYFVYALYNADNKKIYVGQTIDLKTRVSEHNKHVHTGSYTSRFDGEWKLFYSEMFSSRKEALIREKQLKSYRGREFLKNRFIRRSPVAQSVERLAVNEDVLGSSPSGGAKIVVFVVNVLP